MRHQVKGRKFGREKNARKALLRALSVSLIKSEKIKTTEAKAKEMRPFIEKMLTKAKSGTVANRRAVSSKIGVVSAKKLFDKIAPRFKDTKGGYTRITKLPPRKGDASKMAMIEFTQH